MNSTPLRTRHFSAADIDKAKYIRNLKKARSEYVNRLRKINTISNTFTTKDTKNAFITYSDPVAKSLPRSFTFNKYFWATVGIVILLAVIFRSRNPSLSSPHDVLENIIRTWGGNTVCGYLEDEYALMTVSQARDKYLEFHLDTDYNDLIQDVWTSTIRYQTGHIPLPSVYIVTDERNSTFLSADEPPFLSLRSLACDIKTRIFGTNTHIFFALGLVLFTYAVVMTRIKHNKWAQDVAEEILEDLLSQIKDAFDNSGTQVLDVIKLKEKMLQLYSCSDKIWDTAYEKVKQLRNVRESIMNFNGKDRLVVYWIETN